MAYRSRKAKQQDNSIPTSIWFILSILIGLVCVWFRLPALPAVWLGVLLSGVLAKYPTPARKTDEPDARKLASYTRWKNVLRGLKPSKQWWTNKYRPSWWLGFAFGVIASYGAPIWVILINMLFAFMLTQAYCYQKDRQKDHRHPYPGVSIRLFFTHSTRAKLIIFTLITLIGATVSALLASMRIIPWVNALTGVYTLFFTLIWLFARTQQNHNWHNIIDYQQMLDTWGEDPTFAKTWVNPYIMQADLIGKHDNPLIVLRIRVPQTQLIFKNGVSLIQPYASREGYNYVQLLSVGKRTKGSPVADPTQIRLILGKDDTLIPDATNPNQDEKLVSLACDLAYAKSAADYHKPAPLITAHNVSADDSKPAWLLEITCPQGGATIDEISVNWLGYNASPDTILHLPIFADLFGRFHLLANPDTPLSDVGNKWREKNVITSDESFNRFMQLSRRYKKEQLEWQAILGKNMSLPQPYYDNEKTVESGTGWSATVLPLTLTPPYTAMDYATYDYSTLNPEARFSGIIEDGTNMQLIQTFGMAPQRLDMLDGSMPIHRQLARAFIYKAIISILPRNSKASIQSCTQEGKDTPIWRSSIKLSDGATVNDIRKKTASFQAAIGTRYALFDYQSESEFTVWCCNHLYTSIDDLQHWKRPMQQKQLIKLALSDAWAVAGLTDKTGIAPTVTNIGTLPHNKDVIKVRFDLPAGLDMKRVEMNQGKFLTRANYAYGRTLPRGDEHGATLWDMLLCSHNPFPTMVHADWKLLDTSAPRFPFAVNDMAEPVYWEFTSTPHILVSGKTGSGKSSAMQIIAASILLSGHQLIIADPKKGGNDFAQWAKPRAIGFAGNNEWRKTEAVIAWAAHEMQQRVDLIGQYGVGNIKDLPEDVRPKRLFVLFDEFNSYLSELKQIQPNPTHNILIENQNRAINAQNQGIRNTFMNLANIVTQGRSAGVHLVVGAQQLSVSDLKKFANGSAFLKSMGRLLLGMASPLGVVSQDNLKEANRLQKTLSGTDGMNRGRGIYENIEGVLIGVQTWWSGDQQVLKQLVADISEVTPVDVSEFMPARQTALGNAKKLDEQPTTSGENKPNGGESILIQKLDFTQTAQPNTTDTADLSAFDTDSDDDIEVLNF